MSSNTHPPSTLAPGNPPRMRPVKFTTSLPHAKLITIYILVLHDGVPACTLWQSVADFCPFALTDVTVYEREGGKEMYHLQPVWVDAPGTPGTLGAGTGAWLQVEPAWIQLPLESEVVGHLNLVGESAPSTPGEEDEDDAFWMPAGSVQDRDRGQPEGQP